MNGNLVFLSALWLTIDQLQIFSILQIQEGIALVFSREKEGNLFHMMIYEQIPELEGPWPGEIF